MTVHRLQVTVLLLLKRKIDRSIWVYYHDLLYSTGEKRRLYLRTMSSCSVVLYYNEK